MAYHEFEIMSPGIGNVTNPFQTSILYTVETQTGVVYIFYVDVNLDPAYSKSTDYGITFSAPVAFKNCTCTQLAVWYDGWSGITATNYIHVVYTDSGTDDTFYRYLNTADDTLGTERTVYAGSSTASGGTLSITRARGGNLICATCIDAGAEYDTVKSTDLFVNKTSINEVFEGAASDIVVLFPNPDSADNQDVCAIFYDSSGTEISLKKYDDSGDSWGETSILTPITLTYLHQISITINGADAILAIWSAFDTAGADLLCYNIDDSAITAKTNIVTDSTDDQGIVALNVDNKGTITAYYRGSTDGAEDVVNGSRLYNKKSTDGGTSWTAETLCHNFYMNHPTLIINLISYYSTYLLTQLTLGGSVVYVQVIRKKTPSPRANFQLGM